MNFIKPYVLLFFFTVVVNIAVKAVKPIEPDWEDIKRVIAKNAEGNKEKYIHPKDKTVWKVVIDNFQYYKLLEPTYPSEDYNYSISLIDKEYQKDPGGDYATYTHRE